MNTKMKIAAGVCAGLIAGTTLIGTAFAGPITAAGPVFGGYGMMRSTTASGTLERPTFAEMQSFMNRYRTASGIDFGRMRRDVSGRGATAPCLFGAQRSENTSVSPSSGSRSAGRYGMMRGVVPSNGNGMMGGAYRQ